MDAPRAQGGRSERPTKDSSAAAGGSEAGEATALMECYRRTGSHEAFETLVRLTRDRLLRRVRTRTRFLGGRVDPDEVLQDAYVNIFRYPSRFDANRPRAFHVWSAMIVDNAVRRHLRRARRSVEANLRPIEMLAQEPARTPEPATLAMQSEAWGSLARAYRLFLVIYLAAYSSLGERERFVLQMVEVKGFSYAQLAEILGVRPDALKMVVFRARRRVFMRIAALMSGGDEKDQQTRADRQHG